MKAVRYSEYGDASVLTMQDVDRPRPGSGQVLVQVAGTSFNPVDASIRAGHLRQVFPVGFPHTPGIDVAGTVVELGEGVRTPQIGTAVIGFLPMDADGAAAEYVLAPAAVLTAAPSRIPLAEAAALPAVALTAWQALFEHAELKPGQRILVNGAGGGVGGFAVQFAKQAGAFVVATASPRSTDRVRAHGADEVVDYTATSVADALTEPVDVVLNLVLAPESQMAALVALVRPGGIVVTTGSPARPDDARGVRATGMNVRSDAAQLAAIVDRVDGGEIRLDVSETRPLAEIAAVHEQSAAGKVRGKVVLVPA